MARLVNIVDSAKYKDGVILITSRFDSLANGKLKIRDTFDIIPPFSDSQYKFKFAMRKLGWDTIYGEIVFEKKIDDGQYEVTRSWFCHPVYVRDSLGRH